MKLIPSKERKEGRIPANRKKFEELCYSMAIAISIATMVVNTLKMFTSYYFYYLIFLLLCVLVSVVFLQYCLVSYKSFLVG